MPGLGFRAPNRSFKVTLSFVSQLGPVNFESLVRSDPIISPGRVPSNHVHVSLYNEYTMCGLNMTFRQTVHGAKSNLFT